MPVQNPPFVQTTSIPPYPMCGKKPAKMEIIFLDKNLEADILWEGEQPKFEIEKIKKSGTNVEKSFHWWETTPGLGFAAKESKKHRTFPLEERYKGHYTFVNLHN